MYRFFVSAVVATSLALAAGCGNPARPSTAPPAPTFVADLPAGVEGQPYAVTLVVNDGLAPFVWDATGLPAGLTISGADDGGHLTGTPPAGLFFVTLSVTDALGRTASRPAQLSVRSTLAITGTLPEAAEGDAMDAVLSVTGGTGSDYHWRLGDQAPANVHLGKADGRTIHLTGTVVAGTVDVPLIVEDARGGHAEATFPLVGYPRLELVTALVPNADKGAPYSATLAARGGHSSAYVWSVTGGALPDGITLTGDRLEGAPTSVGHFTFTVSVSTSTDLPVARDFEITVGDNPPVITTATLPRATWGVAYLADVAAQSHAGGGVSWRLLDGSLPPGVTLDGSAATAHLSGMPRVRGTFSFTLEASDAGGSAMATFAVAVDRLDRLAVSAATLPRGRVGRAYGANLRALDAHGAVSWTVSVGSLPAGLTIANGRIVGTPASAGWVPFTVAATDADGRTAMRKLAIGINRDAGHVLASYPVFAGQSTVRVVDVSDGTRGAETVLDAGSANLVDVNDFSPGGSFATYSTEDGAQDRLLFLVDLRGTIKQTQLSSNVDNTGYVGEWSPDEHWLAWHDQLDWYVTDLSGAAPTTEKIELHNQVPQVFWSPDSTRLLVPTIDAALIWQHGQPLTTVPIPTSNVVRWSADGGAILCGLTGLGTAGGPVYLVSFADPTPVALTPAVDLSSFFVAPDRATLLATDFSGGHHTGDDTLYAIDLRDEQLAQAVVADHGPLSFPSWSHDGQRLLQRHGAASIYLFERAQLFDGGPTKLAPAGAANAGWGADADHVVFFTDGLYESTIGSGMPEPIAAASYGVWEWLSPERRVYVYLGSDGALWTVDLAAPSPRTPVKLDEQVPTLQWMVSHGLQSALWWSHQSRRVGLVDLRGAAPGSPTTLFKVPDIGLILDPVEFSISP